MNISKGRTVFALKPEGLSWLLALAWLVSLSVFAVGVLLLFRGFFTLRHTTLCGAYCMLIGLTPCLAGGYHAYYLELRDFAPRFGWLRCLAAYALALAAEVWAWKAIA